MNQFCEMKDIIRQFSVVRTPQQNRFAERRNRTLIEASRTMLADSKLPTTFWAEAVSTACYVQNRVKAFRVFNSRTRIVEENFHIRFSECTPNVVGSGPDSLFDIDALTRTMNYEPIFAGIQSNGAADNNNGWLEEDPKEEPEEEEIEDEDMVNDEEDGAEVINPYEEGDPHNRPPPTSNEETEFAPPVVQIADADDVPIPPVILFGSNFHIGESSATRDLLTCNSEVYAPGPMYRMKKKMGKKLKQDELRMNGQEFHITALDSAVKENRSKNSKMMKLIMYLSREFTELKNQNRRAEELSRWEAWVRGRIPNNLRFQEEPIIYTAPVPRADDPYIMVRDAAMDTRGDEDVDTDAPWDTQPFEPRESPHGIEAAIRDERERFHGTKGAVGLVRSFEKMENTFEINECAKGKKVKFSTAILHGRALTWWNSQVATLGREVANGRPWTEVKQMMTDEFCPTEEVQRLEDELRHLKLRDMNIAAYTERFNELALLCPDAVPNEKKKKIQVKNERIVEGLKRKWENNNQGNNNNNNSHNRGHRSRAYPKKADRRGGNVQGQAYVIRDVEHNQGPNVVTGTFLLNNRYATLLFDSGVDKSFVDIKFSYLIDIKPVKLNLSYEVELADRKVVNTNSVLRGCTLNLLNHLFDIDLMPIELGTFDVIVGMDWLVERDALIVCGEKEVHVPYKNKTLAVKSDSSVS
uniref:Reverse transcriptase domain-containing protein n=1 Tax=Tanacetum cinerariifolium TaxID=118510 RepID=A0A6L2JG29_TANCI|nr:reverse transcriptase domain-containing protein [Tanacetum cinerariifolium]